MGHVTIACPSCPKESFDMPFHSTCGACNGEGRYRLPGKGTAADYQTCAPCHGTGRISGYPLQGIPAPNPADVPPEGRLLAMISILERNGALAPEIGQQARQDVAELIKAATPPVPLDMSGVDWGSANSVMAGLLYAVRVRGLLPQDKMVAAEMCLDHLTTPRLKEVIDEVRTEDRLRVRCEALEALLVARDVGTPFDLHNFLLRQKAFSERAFGPGLRTQMITDHIRKELVEVEAEPEDLEEWVDVILMGLDGAWRCVTHGTEAGRIRDIAQGMVAKLAKNEKRTWPDWRTIDTTKAPHHIEIGTVDRNIEARIAEGAVFPSTFPAPGPRMVPVQDPKTGLIAIHPEGSEKALLTPLKAPYAVPEPPAEGVLLPSSGTIKVFSGDAISTGTDAGDQIITIRRPLGAESLMHALDKTYAPPFTKDELEDMAEGLGYISSGMHSRRHDANRDGRHTDAKEHSRDAARIESLALRLKEMAEKAS